MNKKIFLILLLPILLIPLVSAQEAQTEIPSWVKGVANFWVEGNIDDGEFGEAITFLIERGIIQISSVSTPIENPLTDEEKRLFELELAQKDDRISILEKEVEDAGLDNSHLLNNIVEKEQTITALQEELKQVDDDFKQYKQDYPLKVGNIGGMLVVDYIQQLEERIAELEK